MKKYPRVEHKLLSYSYYTTLCGSCMNVFASIDIPPDPVKPLELSYAESELDFSDAGLYYINATSAASEHNQTEMRYPTAFIIRVSHNGNVKYIIMV